jgi:hypothetical protein
VSLMPMGNIPPWLAQILGQQPGMQQSGMQQPGMRPQQTNPVRNLFADPNFSLALLANSRGQSFGQAIGNAGLQAQGLRQQREDDALRQEYLKAQIANMGRGPQRKPVVVAGPDGKPVYVPEDEAIGKSPFLASQDGIGDYQPGDYTPQSWAKFLANGKKDASVLERYAAPRQESSRPFQNVQRVLPDGSTQQGTFDTRDGTFNWTGEVVPPGTKPRVDAQGRKEGEIAGERVAKGGRAYETFKVGIANLEKALSNTVTGPGMSWLPALTSNQQVAEGAEADMAPILKQLFRESGEGTFTEGDQALLLKMVPTRGMNAEARKIRLQMIDEIVRAKLGLEDAKASGGQSGPAVGTVESGYRFKGGDPADQKNWEPAR